jgi:hypothetical protein
LLGLFWELQRAAATMTNAEVSNGDWLVLARLKLLLQRRICHVIDNVIWAVSKGNKVAIMLVADWVSDCDGSQCQCQDRMHICST